MSKGIFLVTGGSRGIGEAIARDAAAQGYHVLLTYAGDAAAADRVVSAITSAGGEATAIQADTGDGAHVARLFAQVDRLGTLAVMVYNGGIVGAVGPLVDQDDATLAKVVDVNLTGALTCSREAVRRMSTRLGGDGGSIILISSRAAGLGAPNQHVWYAATKGGIDSLTLGLGKEVAAEGIRVNGVSPGPIATDIHLPGHLERIRDALPMKREGTPAEVSAVVMFLVTEAASYVSGTTIQVAGAR
ncbi:SDR family oxidoreductase [Sphingomonas sp. Mn802worker]|uniref:SDR family oxidoreductase n=1 Tax=Sphingomonas sp. Mn802worker TaxID=629773 RepID=UPI0003730674|nr:SDR family oxidoreductase [Sphingomonas sp. Mn802worker]